MLQNLPVEVLHHVFEYFDIQDLGHASRVCHLWLELSKLDLLWKQNSTKYFHKPDPMPYNHYKSFIQQQSRMQLFTLTGADGVYSFDPFSRFFSRGASVTESIAEFWSVMSFLGVQHQDETDNLIEARPRRGEQISSIVLEGLFVDHHETEYEVYLIFYCNYSARKLLTYPITCFCPSLELFIEHEGTMPQGDLFQQQSSIEREMATKMQAILSSKIGTVKFVMWDKAQTLCTKMHRIIDATNYEEESDQGKAKRAQYWFGGVPSDVEEEVAEHFNPRFVFAM